MAFKTKTDPFEIVGSLTTIACKATADGNSASVAEARDENGTIVAQEVFGENMSPSADYAIKGTFAPSAGDIKLGAVTTYKTKRVALTNLTINTSAGGEPTVSASGEPVEESTAGTCPALYSIPAFSLGPCHHAKILFSAFALDGTGCHLQCANYTASCEKASSARRSSAMWRLSRPAPPGQRSIPEQAGRSPRLWPRPTPTPNIPRSPPRSRSCWRRTRNRPAPSR